MAEGLTAVLLWRLRGLNRKKEAVNAVMRGPVEGEQSIDEVGNQHRDFVYQY